MNEETEEENDGIDDDALKVKDAPKPQPFLTKCFSTVKRKISSSASNPDLLNMHETNCDLKKDEDFKSGVKGKNTQILPEFLSPKITIYH